MLRIITLTFLVFFISCTNEWEDIEQEFYQGSLDIFEEKDLRELDSILNLGYNAIDGYLAVHGTFSNRRLRLFNNIYEITGDLWISDSTKVDYFDNLVKVGGIMHIYTASEVNTFDKLEECGGIWFNFCNLTELSGFESLTTCDGISIWDNKSRISEFSAFPELKEIKRLGLSLNQDKTDKFTGLERIEKCNFLSIQNIGKDALPNLRHIEEKFKFYGSIGNNGLQGLERANELWMMWLPGDLSFLEHKIVCNWLRIVECDNIENLQSFPNLDSLRILNVEKCASLKTLDGLPNLSQIESVNFDRNPVLEDFCALTTMSFEHIFTWKNAYNPKMEDMLQGNCSISK